MKTLLLIYGKNTFVDFVQVRKSSAEMLCYLEMSQHQGSYRYEFIYKEYEEFRFPLLTSAFSGNA